MSMLVAGGLSVAGGIIGGIGAGKKTSGGQRTPKTNGRVKKT